MKYAPRTSTAAAARAKAKVGKSNVPDQCAHEVIVNIFGIPAPWKWGGNGKAWAINYFKAAQTVVKTSDPAKIPAGAMVFFDARPGATTNAGKAGHVAVGAGGGYVYSTDLPTRGKWGKVKITEVQRQWGKKLVGYVLVDGMGYTLTDPPKTPAAPAKPASKGRWFTIGSYNLKSPTLTRTGAHKWTLRRPRQIANIAAAHLDVLGTQETGSPADVGWYDDQLGRIGLERVAGSKWRYIWINPDKVTFLAGGTVELGPLYQGDEKQMAWALLDAYGSFTLVGNWHLEESSAVNADDIRPAQASNGVAQLDTIARSAACLKHTGSPIGRDRYVIVGDTNSEGMVTERMSTHGFRSALTNALKSNGGYIATFNNWLASRNGKQIDSIYVASPRPVESWTQKPDSIASDHNLIYAALGRLN